MRLTELLNKDEVTISCELFPPKQGAQLENYKNIVKDMAALKPAYMSVTYGATGGTSDYTVKLAEEVRNNNIPALAHLTCASSTREKVASVIEELKAANIENILALRGDIPANADFPLCPCGFWGFCYHGVIMILLHPNIFLRFLTCNTHMGYISYS